MRKKKYSKVFQRQMAVLEHLLAGNVMLANKLGGYHWKQRKKNNPSLADCIVHGMFQASWLETATCGSIKPSLTGKLTLKYYKNRTNGT